MLHREKPSVSFFTLLLFLFVFFCGCWGWLKTLPFLKLARWTSEISQFTECAKWSTTRFWRGGPGLAGHRTINRRKKVPHSEILLLVLSLQTPGFGTWVSHFLPSFSEISELKSAVQGYHFPSWHQTAVETASASHTSAVGHLSGHWRPGSRGRFWILAHTLKHVLCFIVWILCRYDYQLLSTSGKNYSLYRWLTFIRRMAASSNNSRGKKEGKQFS